MSRCTVAICSPWRTGMTVSCVLSEGHDGLHDSNAPDFYMHNPEGDRVLWTGQNDRWTARNRGRPFQKPTRKRHTYQPGWGTNGEQCVKCRAPRAVHPTGATSTV